jgi:hypothetical protein
MFPDYTTAVAYDNRTPRPDRRQNPRDAEIRMRIRRLARTGA